MGFPPTGGGNPTGPAGGDLTGTYPNPTVGALTGISGAAFPGSPATNELYYRTDLGLLFYFDGTRWLTTTEYREVISRINNSGANIGALVANSNPAIQSLDMWMQKFYLSSLVSTTNDSTNFWTIKLQYLDASNVAHDFSTPAAISTGAVPDTPGTWVPHLFTSIGQAIHAATDPAFVVVATKSATPGALNALCAYSYRLIGT